MFSKKDKSGVQKYKGYNRIHIFQDDRSEILERLSEKQGERAELQKELERYRECDPEVIDAMKEETKVAKEAANRWTGNISKENMGSG